MIWKYDKILLIHVKTLRGGSAKLHILFIFYKDWYFKWRWNNCNYNTIKLVESPSHEKILDRLILQFKEWNVKYYVFRFSKLSLLSEKIIIW